MPTVARLRIPDLRLDSGVQSRVEISAFTVDDYAEAIRCGEKLPPITVFFDGEAYWVSDGFHRALAADQAGKKTIEAEVRKGSRRDAVLHSAGSNSRHGLARTNADKRRAVLLLLNDKEWSRWSNREIARRCAVSEFLVRQAREAICDRIADAERKATRNGKTYTLRTSRIGITQKIAPNVRELIRQTPLLENRNELERIANLAPDEQLKVVQKIAAGEVSNVEFAILKTRREGRQLRLRQELPDLNALGRFRTVVLDPPWDLPKGGRLSPSQHYETMPLEKIRALPIADLAADAHLYLWAVHGFMADAFDLLEAWGFRFITTLTWVKTRRDGKGLNIGPGHYFRGCAEHLLFGVRGDLPSLRNDQPNVIMAPQGRHSEKPDAAYKVIERISPSPYVEVFSRRKRDGWIVWGNEV